MATFRRGFETDRSLSRRNVGARILRLYGGDPASASSTAAAFEGYLSRLGRRFGPLVGQEGYRALLEEAHRTILRDHPLLEGFSVAQEGNPFFGGLQGALEGENPDEIWAGLTELLGAFLSRAGALGRSAEFSIWEDGDGGDLSTVVSEEPSDVGGDRGELLDQAHADHGSRIGRDRRPGRSTPWNAAVLARDRASCEALVDALESARDFHVAGCGLAVRDVVGTASMGRVDFIVVEAQISPDEIQEMLSRLREGGHTERPMVVVTGFSGDSWAALRFIEAGSAGLIMDDFSVQALRLTLRLLARGEVVYSPHLQHLMAIRLSELAELVQERGLSSDALSEITAREGNVLLLLDEGMTNREIAGALFISEGTVKSHVHQILRKLGVRDRSEAVDVFRLHRAGPGELILTRSGFRRKKAPGG